jgi:hypothetical protein
MISLVTAFIAAVVAVIAFLQWQTAREKVLLDLFDKRFALYEEVRAVVGRHLTTGIDQPDIFSFAGAASRAQFLFGPEVQAFLDQRRVDLGREMAQRKIIQPQPILDEEKRAATQTVSLARADRLSNFFKDLDVLVAPYMNHHQKALGSISDWVRSLRRTRPRSGPPPSHLSS